MCERGTLDHAEPGMSWLDDGHRLTLERFADAQGEEPHAPAQRFPQWQQTHGLADLQVNGFAGVDFNDAHLTAEALDHALQAMLATGVTLCLPTLITAEATALAARLKALDAAVSGSRLGPVMVPGYHLEGPFLNPAPGYAGCHPPEAMKSTDTALLERLQALSSRPILLTTLAPEHPAGAILIQSARSAGRLVAMGHSSAGNDQVQSAVDAGVTLSTHLGNGLPPQLAKFDNTLFAQLAQDGLSASFIADGIHIPPFALRAILRAKGMDRSLLVTDAVSAAASPPGLYDFAGMPIELTGDGRVSQPGEPHLAGSALCLDQAMRNLVRWEICSPLTALQLACHNPRQLLYPALHAFGIEPTPSRVIWNERLEVIEASVGHWCWQR